ncbi:IclR family transcriptional regulator [Blastococcus goldschmidtiae]|uniref:IclR family transcriptional regulator n=1 Tax=Blastococcus goldschmidtiae TaxID=3075546 RepID=A0ABU2K8X1_9ACTN|nr:IclR family transcriptional regulator [Blastococcus sp. DSM 46792]MDT0276641.1 IclR family transcriptional regulator [Blastococcus sp. DSM 46792]
MRNGADGDGPALVQSVDRALAMLSVLADRGSAGVTDLGAELGVHKSTASRLLATLEAHGLVEQLGERGTYRLGFGLVRLAGASAAQLDLTRLGREACERLAAELDETVNLAVRDGDSVVNISQVQGSASVGLLNWVGRRTPLHATSSGKVLLAFGPAAVRRGRRSAPLERYTPATITDTAALEQVLDEVCVRGWAATEGELELGLNAVAAPVCTADGGLIAALSVSAPSYRLPPERFDDVAEKLCVVATETGRQLG